MTSKILVADDSTTIQKIVTMAFENEDMEVQGVGNGKEAWEKLAALDPDVVLADVDMPGLSGFDLSRRIKSSAEHQKRRVILLCSDFEEFDEKEFKACGADDHLSKPFKSEDVISVVKRQLSGEVAATTLPVVETAPSPEPEEPAATLELSADDLIDELLDEEDTGEPVVELSAADMEPEPEEEPAEAQAAPVMELSVDDIEVEEETEPAVELDETSMIIDDDPVPVSDAEKGGAYLLTDDQQVPFDETLVPDAAAAPEPEPAAVVEPEADMTEPEIEDESSPEYYLGERPRTAEAVDDLDDAFRSVVKTTPRPEPEPAQANNQAEGSKPDLIRETRAFMEQQGAARPEAPSRPEPEPSTREDKLEQVMSQHAVRVLEASLERNLKKELSGLNDQVRQVVRDVVKEIAPEIIRSVIREEIENIRKMEEV